MWFFNNKRRKFINSAQFKNVLVPVDGSGESYHAVKTASELIKRTSGLCLLLNIIEIPLTFPLTAAFPEEEEKAKKIISAALEVAKRNKVRAEGKVEKHHSIRDGILKFSQHNAVETILFAMKPKPEGSKAVFSPIIEYVMKRADADVIIDKLP